MHRVVSCGVPGRVELCIGRSMPEVDQRAPQHALMPCDFLVSQDGSSVGFVDELEKDLKAACAAGCDAKIASGGGRMGVTMDRYEVGTCQTYEN